MEEIDHLRFLSWRSEFVLTEAWTPLGRHVRFIGQSESGEAVLEERYLVRDAETPEVAPEWESSDTGGAPDSTAWAKASNDEYARRAWEQLMTLRDASTHVRLSPETARRVRFLESVVNVFLVWYTRLGFPSPIVPHSNPAAKAAHGTPSETRASQVERQGHAHAKAAYKHLADARNMMDLWQQTTGRKDGYRAFLSAVTRDGFYPQGESRDKAAQFDVFKHRVVAYVEQGEWPERP